MSTRTPIIKLAGAAALLLTLGLTGPVHAATGGTYAITVTTSSDTPVGAPSNYLAGGTGYSCSLRQSTEAASTGPSGTYTITVPANTYTLQYGPLTLDNNTISVVGYTASSTIVDGSGNTGSAAGSDFVIGSVGNTASGAVTLKNLGITHGTGTTLGSNFYAGTSGGGVLVQCCTVNLTFDTITANTAHVGGGVANNAGTVTITNSAITNNSVDFYSGGVYNDNTMTIRSSNISGNMATGANGNTGFGGGIGNDYGSSTLQMTYSTVNNNIAGGTSAAAALSSGNGSYGGGIHNLGMLQITGGTVNSNTSAEDVGGIYNYAAATLTNLAIENNRAGFSDGGIFNGGSNSMTGVTIGYNLAGGGAGYGPAGYAGGEYNTGTESITDSTIINNQALTTSMGDSSIRSSAIVAGRPSPSPARTSAIRSFATTSLADGGGLFNRGRETMSHTRITGNRAADGAGIFEDSLPLYVSSTTMTNNVASHDGGALYIAGVSSGSGTVVLQNSTIQSNTANVQTGGVYNDTPGDFTYPGTTISNNTGDGCPNIFQPCS